MQATRTEGRGDIVTTPTAFTPGISKVAGTSS